MRSPKIFLVVLSTPIVLTALVLFPLTSTAASPLPEGIEKTVSEPAVDVTAEASSETVEAVEPLEALLLPEASATANNCCSAAQIQACADACAPDPSFSACGGNTCFCACITIN